MPKNEFDEIETLLKKVLPSGVKFKDKNLLTQAFYHRSYLNEVKLNLESNERLEFLGDSILSLVVSYYLYTLRGSDNEGELTNLRAYIVKTTSLAAAAKKLNLGAFLRLSKGEEVSGGRNNPQLLANTYEALLGAIFLDLGLDSVKEVINQTLLSLFEKEVKLGPPKDAKSELQEVVQERLRESPHYKILETKGPDHAKEFTVAVFVGGRNLGNGSGNSKQIAEEHAAREALERLT